MAHPLMKFEGVRLSGMPCVLLTNTKGGSGKTSEVQALAVAAAQAGYRVVIFDIDPNGSISKWKKRRRMTSAVRVLKDQLKRYPTPDEVRLYLRDTPDPPDEIIVSPMQPHAMEDALELSQRSGRTFAIIDVAGAKHNFTDELARFADVVLIPTRPSTKEMENLGDVLAQLKMGGDPPRFISFNRVHASTTSGLDPYREFVREAYNLLCLPIHFTRREGLFDKADDMGLGPQEVELDGPTKERGGCGLALPLRTYGLRHQHRGRQAS